MRDNFIQTYYSEHKALRSVGKIEAYGRGLELYLTVHLIQGTVQWRIVRAYFCAQGLLLDFFRDYWMADCGSNGNNRLTAYSSRLEGY